MLRRSAIATVWAACALVLALGAGGIAAALDHLPGGTGRPELTWAADRAVAPDLDAATADLRALAAEVEALGADGRSALAALVARDATALANAVSAGTARLDAIDVARAGVRARLEALPLAGATRTVSYSAATLARYDALVQALPAVEPLRPAWERLAAGVAPAIALADHLLAHDQIAGEAIRLGSAGRYRDAIARIGAAAAELTAARRIRDALAAAVDVATLDDWISRNATYDEALRALWDALRQSGGRVTPAVRAAADRERAAKELLPPDARALVIILGDVARGGLNQAVIGVEVVRGGLLDAIARAGGPGASEPTPGPPTPSAAPTPSPAPTPVTSPTP